MSETPTARCGHDCCDEERNPHHSHFLEPSECLQCGRVRTERENLESLVNSLVNRIGPPTKPTQLRYDADLDASAGTLYVLAYDDHLGDTVGRRATSEDILTAVREMGGVVETYRCVTHRFEMCRCVAPVLQSYLVVPVGEPS